MGVTVYDRKYDISIKRGASKAFVGGVGFVAATKKITGGANDMSWIETGDNILVEDTTNNNGYFTVAVGGVIAEVVVNETLVDEAGAAPTITVEMFGFMTVPTGAESRRRANDFAPVIAVPGAQLEYAEDVWRPWTMGDFRGGLGQEDWEDPTRFFNMTAGLRIYKNRITLDTQFASEDAAVIMTKGVDFLGNHYAIDQTGSHKNVRKRTTATGLWSTVKTTTQTIHDICVYGGRLWICTSGAWLWHSTDGSAWTERQQPAGLNSIRRLLNYRQYLWGTTPYDTLWFSDDPVNDVWEGGIKVGDLNSYHVINGLAVLGGIIAIGRTNGIYVYEGSGTRAEGPIIDFENMTWSGNCNLFTVTDGFLYYNVGNRIKKTDLRGAEFDVTPTISGDTAKETYGFGTPIGGQGLQGHIYVGFDDMEALYPVVLEMPTIEIGGWRKVYEGASGDTMRGAWFSDIADRLLVNDGATRTQRFNPHSDAPYPDYVQTAHIITSRFDAGDVWSKKLFNKILSYARDLTATETIKVEYEVEYSGAWVTIDTFTSGTKNEALFAAVKPPGTYKALSARKARLRITLSRDAGDSTKRPTLILPLVASYMVRPEPVYSQQVMVRLADNMGDVNGLTIPVTATMLKTFLRACEAYELPIRYTDRYGDQWDIFISRTEEIRPFKFTDRAGTSRIEDVMILTMKEVQEAAASE